MRLANTMNALIGSRACITGVSNFVREEIAPLVQQCTRRTLHYAIADVAAQIGCDIAHAKCKAGLAAGIHGSQ